MMHYPYYRQSWRTRFMWLGIGLVCIIIIALIAFSITHPVGEKKIVSQKSTPAPLPVVRQNWSTYFATTTLVGKAAYVADLSTGQTLFAKNASEPLALASLTKLMTTATALDSAPTTTVVAITRLSLLEGWGGDSGLYVQERWRLGDLLRFTLVVSSNDGATSIAQNIGALLENPTTIATQEHITTAHTAELPIPNASALVWSASTTVLKNYQAAFVSKMNTLASQIGLTHARFLDPSGLDLSTTTSGAYASAEDVAKLITYDAARYPNIIDATRFPTVTETSLNNIVHTGKNTDLLTLGGLNIVASKTGYTDIAGGNLAVIVNIAGHPIVIVVLGSTESGRFADVAALASTSAAVVAAGG